jgi:F420-dependent oxidoreductase-like protein
VRLSVHLVRYPWEGGPAEIAPGLVRVARAAEAVGASGLSVVDHYFGSPRQGPVDNPMLEGYSALAYLAAATTALQLRLLVSGVTYRHPGTLIKIATTLDVLSGGRAELGLGAAWYAREHHGLGVPFPSLAERFERLEETLQIALQMWSPNNGAFRGRHYALEETLCSPMPLAQPHPPIVVGGKGERKTLPLVARYADACNLLTAAPPEVAHKLSVLRQQCDIVGRSYDQLGKSIVYGGNLLTTGRHEQFVRRMAQCAALGVEEVVVVPAGNTPERWIRRHCSEVVPQLATLGPR